MTFLDRWDDPSRPTFGEALRDVAVRALAPGVLLFAVIAGIGFLIVGPLRGLEGENEVNRWFEDQRTPLGETITLFQSSMGNTEYVIGVGVIVALVVYWRTRKWWYAVVPLVSISVQALIFVAAAYVVGRPRPNVERLDPTPPTSSYPSGHVGASTALYIAFALMATRIENVVARRVLVTLCVLVPFSVGFARLYRGAHHVTDIVFGMLNGVVCALLAWGYLRRDPHRSDPGY
ncbi:phosphatase PAP2 family protein [Phycicoccus flavus]|uniref:phosphatase PAP2 family protein n=1 Tax=Phycicoccus flavus TaxID=2502783 RepID=UPI000FEB7205|nr:phosphatase PAP2 family protein [Phycicoccus flavus]NHA68568.1 phosphatase PAP2 family protein [Phycicoccus flavus]